MAVEKFEVDDDFYIFVCWNSGFWFMASLYLTLRYTKIGIPYPDPKTLLKMMFLFQQWDMDSFPYPLAALSFNSNHLQKVGPLEVEVITGVLSSVSKVVSTHLWNTPLNLYQQAIKGFLS